MARKLEELSAEFDFERNVFGRGDERVIIGMLADANRTIVKGRAAEGDLETGMTYRFYGYWTEHERYGRQFAFQSFIVATPAGQRGTVAYLQRASGIGRIRALAIWDAYGPQSLEILRTKPEEVAAKINGLTVEAAMAAAERFEADAAMEGVTIDLTELLSGRGFRKTLPKELVAEFGTRAAEAVRENPWILLSGRFKGCGFNRVDSLYLELGKPADTIERQGFCAWHALASDNEGHTWYPAATAADAIRQRVGGANIDVTAAVRWAIDEKWLAAPRRGGDGVIWLAEADKAGSESRIAECIHQAESETANWPEIPQTLPGCPGVSEHQREQIGQALGGTIAILAGAPGTGKTFCLATIIKAIGPSGRIAVAAPTGKAAVRATESLAKQGLSIQATTIHRLLVVESAEDGWRFQHDAENPLSLDWIFVDEASMIDTPLMAHLLAARPAGCHVLFVGDPDQLSPVGHGAPLRDLIAAGLPCGHLTEIQRNAGRIVKACRDMRERKQFRPAAKIDLAGDDPENLILIERGDARRQIQELTDLLGRIGAGRQYDPVWDVQIVVAVNDKSELGRKPLNRQLQGLLNPGGARADGNPFRVGDKIINTKNGFLPQAPADRLDKFAKDVPRVRVNEQTNADGKVFCANGEQARVQEVSAKWTIVRLWNPDRLLLVPRGGGDGEDETGTGCNWELGYAISVHKSQGSEWPIVIVMVDSYPGALRLCDRHWVYTAISRAKTMCLCIGKRTAAELMVAKSHMWRRKTFLREKIAELRTAAVGRMFDLELAEV